MQAKPRSMCSNHNVPRTKSDCTIIAIPHRNSQSVLKTSEISHLSASSNYTYIHHKDKTFLASKTLGFFQDKLCDKTFIRTHQSFAVNIDFIKSIDFKASMIFLRNGFEIPIARSRKSMLKAFLGS